MADVGYWWYELNIKYVFVCDNNLYSVISELAQYYDLWKVLYLIKGGFSIL